MFGDYKFTFGSSTAATDSDASRQRPTATPFGQSAAAPAFGASTTALAFGASAAVAQSAFHNMPKFGAPQPSTIPSLSGFGQTTPQQINSVVGQAAAVVSTSPNTMTNTVTANTSAGDKPIGSSDAKYQPTIGTDTVIKGGESNNVATKQHCITAMKEYEAKSLEELRLEDYTANRKGPQAATSIPGEFFGSKAEAPKTSTGPLGTNTNQTTSLFGETNKPIFGNKPVFGPSTSEQTNSSNTQQKTNLMANPFGQNANTGFGVSTQDTAAKPFGPKPAFGQPVAPSLFGINPVTSTSPAFGQQGFGGFGATAGQQQPSMFGKATTEANKPAFGQPAATNLFSATSKAPAFGQPGSGGFGATAGQKHPSLFGNATTEANKSAFGQPAATNLFGQNPATSKTPVFGQPGSGGFSAPADQKQTSLFGNATTEANKSGFGQPAATNLFGKSPATSKAPAFGQPGSGGFGATTDQKQPSMFGNATTEANKPAFGQPAVLSLFGQGFGGFGGTAGHQPSMFGNTNKEANKTTFGFVGTLTATPMGQSNLDKPGKLAFEEEPSFGAQQIAPSLFGTSRRQETAKYQQRMSLYERLSIFRNIRKKSISEPAMPCRQQTTSAFGTTIKPGGFVGFGQTTPERTNYVIGQPAAAFGTFGQTNAVAKSVFGSKTPSPGQPVATSGQNQSVSKDVVGSKISAFGEPTIELAKMGTSIAKYKPTEGEDPINKNIKTKMHCITAMTEYEAKSLEELRLEDFKSSRKDAQQDTSTIGEFLGATTSPLTLFQTPTQQPSGLFIFGQAAGAPEKKPLFGTSASGQLPNFSTFSSQTAATGFGAPTQNAGKASEPFVFGCSPPGKPTLRFGHADFKGSTPILQQPSILGITTFNGKPTSGFFTTPNAKPFTFGKPAKFAFGQESAWGAQQTAPWLCGTSRGQTQAPSPFGKTNTAELQTVGGFSQTQPNLPIFTATQPTTNTTWSFGPYSSPAYDGQTNTATINVSINTSGFGQLAGHGGNACTSVTKYQATTGTDTLLRGGQWKDVATKQHCITAMKEYEDKSLEELRLEHYKANQKDMQASFSTTSRCFGITTQPGTLFGRPAPATDNKLRSGFGGFGQPNTLAFGKNILQENNFLTHYGDAATTGFAAQVQNAALNAFGPGLMFGQTATPNLFGYNSAPSTASACGQPGYGTININFFITK